MFQNQKSLLVCFGISSAFAVLSLGAIFAARPSDERAPPPERTFAAVASAHGVEQAPTIVELPALHIVGTLRRARATPRASASASASAPAPGANLVPCSDWRSLGPVYSARAGEVPRERHVRLLCARTNSLLDSGEPR